MVDCDLLPGCERERWERLFDAHMPQASWQLREYVAAALRVKDLSDAGAMHLSHRTPLILREEMHLFLSALAEEAPRLFSSSKKTLRFVAETNTIDGRGLYASATFKMPAGAQAMTTPFLSFGDFKQHLDNILTDTRPEIIECLDLSECMLLNDDVPILTKARATLT